MRAIVIHAAKDLRIERASAVADLGPDDVEVRIEAGGICGSDLHYYQHGGFGVIRIKEPMILGHEVAGKIARTGGSVTHLKAGTRVAVSPSRPCRQCRYCQAGQQQHCLDMRFYGSAMRFPHVQGAFRDVLVADAGQCHPVAPTLTAAEAAMAEPLAVCLHAGRQAGPLLGRRVLVTGSGPIGVLCMLVARRAGAAEIVITDVTDAPLAIASRMGADRTVNVAREADRLSPYAVEKGTFDVLFEASGNQQALVSAFDVLRPGGTIVQVGLGGNVTLPINTIVAKELQLRGTFRFHEEYALAVDLMGKGLIDVKPLVTATLPMERAVEAFELAGDRSKAMKVQLAFGCSLS
jgi:L-idonate 5-dehydrogenase